LSIPETRGDELMPAEGRLAPQGQVVSNAIHLTDERPSPIEESSIETAVDRTVRKDCPSKIQRSMILRSTTQRLDDPAPFMKSRHGSVTSLPEASPRIAVSAQASIGAQVSLPLQDAPMAGSVWPVQARIDPASLCRA
jgi:hypothetical protein